MVSKDKDTLPKSQTTTSAMEENIAPQPLQRGLASIAASTATEAGKCTDVVQKAQVSLDAIKGKSTKESPHQRRDLLLKKLPLHQQCALVSTLWKSGSRWK